MESESACQAGDDLLPGRPNRLVPMAAYSGRFAFATIKGTNIARPISKLLLHFRDVLQDELKSLARLHGEIEEREAKIRRLVDANIIGIIIWDLEGSHS